MNDGELDTESALAVAEGILGISKPEVSPPPPVRSTVEMQLTPEYASYFGTLVQDFHMLRENYKQAEERLRTAHYALDGVRTTLDAVDKSLRAENLEPELCVLLNTPEAQTNVQFNGETGVVTLTYNAVPAAE